MIVGWNWGRICIK